MTAITLDLRDIDATIIRVLRAFGLASENAFPDLLDSIYHEIDNVLLPLLDQLSATAINAEDRIAIEARAVALRGLVRLRAAVPHSAQTATERQWAH